MQSSSYRKCLTIPAHSDVWFVSDLGMSFVLVKTESSGCVCSFLFWLLDNVYINVPFTVYNFLFKFFRQGPFSHTGTRTLKQSVKGNTRFANLSCNISCAMFFSCCILSDLKPCVFNKSSTSLFSSTCKFDVVRLIYEHNEFNSFSSAVRARQKRNVFHE